ncbi:hypothetical protein G6F37_009681 [Rhizopus arrhizus]|nr:hypothetical protein G6F37_009681 [Rhizopus arrhizus]
MLPNYASSSLINHLFTANFILYFIGAGLSFLLWLASLPSLCAAGRRMKRGRRACAGLMALLTGFTFLVMLAALILGLVLVISSVKAIGQTSDAWQGHAGIAVWFTIGSVVSLFLAFLCYTMRSCLKTQNVHPAKRKYQPFDLPAHQPTHQQNTPQMPHSYDHQPLNNQYQTTNQTSHYPMANPIHTGQVDSSTEHYPSSLSQQYSPNLNMQYLSPIYNSGAPQRT